MKRTAQEHREQTSATLTQTLLVMAGCSALFALTAYASAPGWWSGVLNGHSPNDYMVANQGQLKFFTEKAAAQLNTSFASSGGAGYTLSNMVYNWQQDYATNGYSGSNPKPSDYQAINLGQLKYIASLVYGQLAANGYGNLSPSWLVANPNSDYMAANLGQLKEAFDFDLSLADPTSLSATTNSGGVVNVSWTLPAGTTATSWVLEQQNPNGSWSVLTTITNPATTTYAVSNLAAGENPAFQLIAQNGRSVSVATSTPPDTGLTAPSNVHASIGVAAGEIDLTWQNNATDATYVSINESPDGVHWASIATVNNTNATSYAVTNLTVGQSYYFGVSAGNN
ncbi:MAG: fibronectin type III domain-containing protein [Methylacidiphilales bacterium]|nr:fibronectin type III domain-containing protein [Candidatus Methylacidiphilales bacterium]